MINLHCRYVLNSNHSVYKVVTLLWNTVRKTLPYKDKDLVPTGLAQTLKEDNLLIVVKMSGELSVPKCTGVCLYVCKTKWFLMFMPVSQQYYHVG